MLTSDYIVGLTDGEGSFTVYIWPPNRKHGSISYRAQCHYYIKLRDDDKSLLDSVKKFFRIGRVVFQSENRPNHHHMYRFEVSNLFDLQNRIIPFFEKHKLRSKRVKDFELFKKIVRSVLSKEHQTKGGLRKIQHWKSSMHQYRAR